MDRLPGAVALARALLTLTRSRVTGVLEVRGEHASARLAIVEGTPRAAALRPCDDETLGDVLTRRGALDQGAHARALRQGLPVGPVGDWLVATGSATRTAVDRALRDQLTRRIAQLFAWHDAEFRFRSGSADVGLPALGDASPTQDVVLAAIRDVVAEIPAMRARRRLGDGVLVLTRLGEMVVQDAALRFEEAAMLPVLRRGAPVDVVLATAGATAAAIRALYAFKLLAAASPPAAAGRAYGVLLRKQRQIRRAAGGHDLDLLDLPPGARPREARRALRRLAHVVHPDRFGDGEVAAVRTASREVMTALVQAERRVSGS